MSEAATLEPAKSPFTHDWEPANNMLSQMMPDILAANHPTLVFQNYLQGLDEKTGNLVGSHKRWKVIEEIEKRDTDLQNSIGYRLGKVEKPASGRNFLDEEIFLLSSAVDRNRFDMQALLSDLYMKAENDEQACIEYTAAMQTARRNGGPVMQ